MPAGTKQLAKHKVLKLWISFVDVLPLEKEMQCQHAEHKDISRRQMDLQRCWEPQSLVVRSLCYAVTTHPTTATHRGIKRKTFKRMAKKRKRRGFDPKQFPWYEQKRTKLRLKTNE